MMHRVPPPPEATIAEAWASFSKIAIPADAGQHQIDAMRAAFYSGAMVGQGLTLHYVNTGNDAALSALMNEAIAFAKELT
jgi:hypothetical protein